jgi:membrane protein implicated in regulation of membrane protease activity
VGAVLVWYSVQRKRPPAPPTEANRDVNLDIGESVHVDAWNADGTATVRYRGAQWTVIQRAGHTPSTGEHRVVEVVGSRLVVDKV